MFIPEISPAVGISTKNIVQSTLERETGASLKPKSGFANGSKRLVTLRIKAIEFYCFRLLMARKFEFVVDFKISAHNGTMCRTKKLDGTKNLILF